MSKFDSIQLPSLTDDLGAYLQYLTVGAVPTVKVQGHMRAMSMPALEKVMAGVIDLKQARTVYA